MRILFITDDFHPYFGANSLIVKTLSEQLIHNGNSVYVMPFSRNDGLPRTEMWNGIQIVRSVYGDGKAAVVKLLKSFRFLDVGRILVNRIARKARRNSVWLKEIVSARAAVEQLVRKEGIELVVSVHCSIECCFPVYYLKKKHKLPCKWLIYMLDPFATHSYYIEHYDAKALCRVQHKLLSACDKVLCSSVILEELKPHEVRDIIQKTEVAEYPKIQNIREKVLAAPMEADKIHFVYVGSFNETVRPAKFLFRLIDAWENPNACFHFLGVGWDRDNPYALAGRSNCFFHGSLSWEDALSYECSADYLINIGNVVKNQFPSKLLEYISTGKPIIDFSKHHHGLATDCLEKYQNCLIIYEDESVDCAVKQIGAFTAMQYRQLDYEAIRNCFVTATPEYVAKQIQDI